MGHRARVGVISEGWLLSLVQIAWAGDEELDRTMGEIAPAVRLVLGATSAQGATFGLRHRVSPLTILCLGSRCAADNFHRPRTVTD